MTVWEHYLRYLSEICEGSRTVPAGYAPLAATDSMERAMELQQQIGGDVPGFVRACAADEGVEIPQEAYDSFDLTELLSAADRFADHVAETAPAETDTKTTPDDPPEEEPPRHAFEVFLDSILLDETLLTYLIDVIKREDWLAFFQLSQVAARVDLDPQEFLYWLGHKEFYAEEEERACAVVMDACMERLLADGQGELVAALLSGEKTVFETFRCEAPELVHLPAATYEWFERNYLDCYYPVRFFLRAGGVIFPDTLPKKDEMI